MPNPMPLPDIQTTHDVQALVDAFYQKANHDDLLAPTFQAAAHVCWPRHLTSLYAFWAEELLTGGRATASAQPVPVHLALPKSAPHQHRWIQLFDDAVEEKFAGQRAGQAKSAARRLAATLAQGRRQHQPLPVD